MRNIALLLAVGLTACSVGRPYQRPDIPAPAAWHANTGSASPWPQAEWWQGFQSTQLDDFIAQAVKSNDDIEAAIARVLQADAQARIAGSTLWPAIDASLDATRARQINTSTTSNLTRNQFSAELNASYELDFWGKNRATRAAARAEAAASRFDRATVELTILSSVATTYFEVLELRERLQVADDNLASAQKTLDGLRLQQQAGIANALDVAQQATTVATFSAGIPALRLQLRQTVDALAILLGRTPQSLEIAGGSLADLSRPEVAAGLPSELLTRRPDVAEAEAHLIAANANITAARAALLPSIELTANGGYASTSLSTLINPMSRVFSIGAGLLQPIFEGGALKGELDLNKGRYAELVASYHKTVISALGNVEDSLTAVQQTADQEERLQKAVDAAQRAYDIAQMQMHAGTVNVLTVLNTEGALFTAKDALVQARFSHLQAIVSLFNALGGGWQRQQES